MSNVKWLCVLIAGLGACESAGVLVEHPVSGNAVTVTVPKDVDGADGPLKGVSLGSVDNVTEQKAAIGNYTNNPIKDFYSVASSVPTPGKLLTEVCKGELYSDGKRVGSCVRFEAKLVIEDKPDGSQLSITPVKMTTQQARNVLGVSLALPQVDISDWYEHVMDQKVSSHYKVTSKFAPEAVKASFDRHFKAVADTEGDINAALRQFRQGYEQPGPDGTNAHIIAAFSPYQDGTMIDCEIALSAAKPKGQTAIDWSATLAAVRQELDHAAAE